MNIDTVTNGFNSFLQHGSAVSVLLSLGFGWGFAILASYPIHWNVSDDERATYYSRCTAVAGSFVITLLTWPNDFRLAWALTMGVLSPLLGLVVLALLGKWKPDLVANVLSMKKTTTGETK
jgi:hypothetical protein